MILQFKDELKAKISEDNKSGQEIIHGFYQRMEEKDINLTELFRVSTDLYSQLPPLQLIAPVIDQLDEHSIMLEEELDIEYTLSNVFYEK